MICEGLWAGVSRHKVGVACGRQYAKYQHRRGADVRQNALKTLETEQKYYSWNCCCAVGSNVYVVYLNCRTQSCKVQIFRLKVLVTDCLVSCGPDEREANTNKQERLTRSRLESLASRLLNKLGENGRR